MPWKVKIVRETGISGVLARKPYLIRGVVPCAVCEFTEAPLATIIARTDRNCA